MQTKFAVLENLSQNEGKAVSGQALASALGVSRMAVSKSVKALIASGYKITAQTNRGYTLRAGSDVFTQGTIKSHYSHAVFYENSTSSTNTLAKQLAINGACNGTLFAAASQTGGRGRHGKSFYSPSGSGMYFSLVLRNIRLENAGLITAAAGVATVRVIKKLYGIELSIKWVNDLFYKGKKVCGILTEAAANLEAGGVEYAIVGVGLNLFEPVGGFPPEIKDVAGAIFEINTKISRAQICADIATEIMHLCESQDAFIEEYRSASCIIGHQIKVLRAGEHRIASAMDINDRGHLLVKYDDGISDELYFGEVSVLNGNGDLL